MMKMLKMAAVALLLLCCLLASTDSQDDCNKFATEGRDIVVPLNYNLQGSDALKWLHNDLIIFHQRGNTFIIGSKNDVENGSLKLKNVKKSSRGKYTPQVYDKNGRSTGDVKTTYLCVFDNIQKPEVKTACSKSDQITFTCNVGGLKNLSFEWLKNKQVIKNQKSPTLKLQAKDVEEDSFECKVSNPALTVTSEVVKQNCISTKLFGFDFWIMVGILAGGGGLVLVLIIIVIVCCIRARRKKSMTVKDEEELRLGWTNPDQQQHQQQHHHHHHQHHHEDQNFSLHPHHQKQPAGHTGPRQHRAKQHRDPRSKVPELPNGQPQPSPRRAAQAPRPVENTDDEQPPPLPQPRKKGPRTPRV